jgi:hypothetical protein
MAENKKSFILYADQYSTINILTDEQAGKLLKHIYAYVNDASPTLDDQLLKLAFEPIKLQFKRDLRKWESTKEQKSKAGVLGNLKRYHSDLYDAVQKDEMQLSEAQKVAEGRTAIQEVAKLAVNVNVNDNVNDNVSKSDIEERKLKFAHTLKPFIDKYGKGMIREFYEYWTEPNKSNTEFKQEMEATWSLSRRLDKWSSYQSKFGGKEQPKRTKAPSYGY